MNCVKSYDDLTNARRIMSKMQLNQTVVSNSIEASASGPMIELSASARLTVEARFFNTQTLAWEVN